MHHTDAAPRLRKSDRKAGWHKSLPQSLPQTLELVITWDNGNSERLSFRYVNAGQNRMAYGCSQENFVVKLHPTPGAVRIVQDLWLIPLNAFSVA